MLGEKEVRSGRWAGAIEGKKHLSVNVRAIIVHTCNSNMIFVDLMKHLFHLFNVS